MICPNCGETIKDENLYCEKCGNEIYIVPDFEPEIEDNIKKSLQEMIQEVGQNTKQEKNQEEHEDLKKGNWNNRLLLLLCSAFALVLVILSLVGVIIQYQYNSVAYQINEAAECISKGKVEEAMAYYERAIELDEENISIRFQMAEIYKNLGNEISYIEQLLLITQSNNTTDNESEKAYNKIIQFYISKENYKEINELLLNCTNINILDANQNFLAKEPEFSYQEGVYAEIVPLKLSSNTKGTIYYTLDGTTPDSGSEIYTTPIFLETGKYIISAFFVNEYGISSEIVSKRYNIDVLKPVAPDVQVYSGEYIYPTMITVDVPEGYSVYYTTDGSVPSIHSVQYVNPIPMPIGKSNYKFIMYDPENVSGEITSREYELELQTEYTPQDASKIIVEAMMEKGKIYDYQGNNHEVEGRYKYGFQFALSIVDAGDFYVISEIYEDTAGVQNKTGTNYAVNVYSLEKYKLLTDEDENYLLEEF